LPSMTRIGRQSRENCRADRFAAPPIQARDCGAGTQPQVDVYLNTVTQKRRPTISDVAQLCGVNNSTVSRVLNGKKKFSTTPAVRERILATARKLGYAPDLSARNLGRQSTHIIGLFASPQASVTEGINEFIFEGLSSVLHPAGYDVFVELSPPQRIKKAVPFWRFDGAVLLAAPNPEVVEELDRRHTPYICVNERVGHPAACVLADDALGMNRAIAHLSQLGHKRFAYANAPANYTSHYSITERYETLLSSARDGAIELVCGHDKEFSSATEFLRSAVTQEKATAVITYDHRIAIMLVGAAAGLGIKIPEQFSIICFNDVFPVGILHPSLTAVTVAGHDMGRIGASLLLNKLTTSRSQIGAEIRVAEDLVVRGSTAPPPCA
jgi:LacI family transcriptional regulator